MKKQARQAGTAYKSEGKTIDTAEELQDKKLALDYEIRVNIANAFEEFGQEGVDRVADESARFAELLRKNEIPDDCDFEMDDSQSTKW